MVRGKIRPTVQLSRFFWSFMCHFLLKITKEPKNSVIPRSYGFFTKQGKIAQRLPNFTYLLLKSCKTGRGI